MTYEEIIKLKFNDGKSTQELFQQYPNDRGRIQEVALLDLSDATLKTLISEKKILKRVLRLKKNLPDL